MNPHQPHRAADFGVHRTTVAEHLERNIVPRHSKRVAWDERTLRDAAELYAAGLSLADVANRSEIDAQTVANRFRRAGVPDSHCYESETGVRYRPTTSIA